MELGHYIGQRAELITFGKDEAGRLVVILTEETGRETFAVVRREVLEKTISELFDDVVEERLPA